MATVAVVGSGAWGTALAAHAATRKHDVTLWAREADVVASIEAEHENKVFLPDAKLPKSVRATGDAAKAVSGAQFVILAPPSQHLRAVSEMVAPHLAKDAVIIVASKGIEESTLELLSTVLSETLARAPTRRVAFLSGPSFAREVVRGLPTDVVVASESADVSRGVQEALHAPMFRVYTSADPVGVQIGGAVKNVIAVAAGACDTLGLGTNARAALITRGLAEITRLGVSLGADPLTFLGMAGVGDLVLTCTGELSRNRMLGVKVAQGAEPQAYVASQRAVAEGYYTAAAAHALAQKRGVDMPITEQVYHVLHNGRPLLDALQRLVTRDFKSELTGIK